MNKKKKITYTIRFQFTLIFFLLIAGTIFTCWILNSTFLERYYQQKTTQGFKEVYELLEDASYNGKLTSEDVAVEIDKEASRGGINIIVVSEESKSLIFYGSDKQTMIERVWENMTGRTEDLDEALEEAEEAGDSSTGISRDDIGDGSDLGKNVLRDPYYNVEDIEVNDDAGYSIRIVLETRTNTEAMEMWGILSDNNYFLMRAPLSNINNSTRIASRFLAILGVFTAIIGALIALFMATNVTKPIRELTQISERMKQLDFSTKYKGKSRTEVSELGENINDLSETLERTLSELKSANNQLQQDIRKKEEVEQMRQDFLSNVTHELKTPLALIQGYAEGLQDGIADDPESADFYCEVIIEEAGKMNKMVQKLLTLNQLEFGNNSLRMEHFDIVEIIRNYLRSAALLAEQQGVTLTMNQHEPVYVWADSFMTEEVFMNYYSNALNHVSGDKRIDVKFTRRKNCVRVSVFNTGDPIPEESVPHLWEKFYKVDKARTRKYGGSGVGLSIVKAIMNLMNQDYGVINHDNGVEFWFELETRNAPEESAYEKTDDRNKDDQNNDGQNDYVHEEQKREKETQI